MSYKQYRFQKAEEILGEFEAAMLSALGRQLFVVVWNSLRRRDLTSIWMLNENVSLRAHIPLANLPKYQNELHRAGVLTVTVGATSSKYELPVTEVEATQV